MGPYPKSPITTFGLYKAYFRWAYPDGKWWDVNEKDYTLRDKIVEKTLNFTDILLWPVNLVLLRNFNRERKIQVRIDDYDTWSADYTLAQIIHPLLVKLEKHGTPYTEREDAPSDTKYDDEKKTEGNVIEGYCVERWNYILGEMIFAFSMLKEGDWDFAIYKKNNDEWTDEAFEERENVQKRIQNGLRLFGKYYQSLWD
jgi:hypothetical protein